VPSVDGQSAALAQSTLQEAGFVVTMLDEFDDTVSPGVVIGTIPAADERIPKGGAITIQVSKGPLMVPIPTVVGVDIVDAKARLADAAFPTPIVNEIWDDVVPAGEVMSCSPDQQTMARHDATITLVVSLGPEPITIPNVVGATEQTALDTLAFYALDVSVQRGRSLDVSKGQVYKQDPEGNAEGFRAQEMTIWVSDGKPLVIVQDYRTLDKDIAKAQAENLGLDVTLKKLNAWCGTGTTVRTQSIDPFSEVEMGTTITLGYCF